MEIEIWEWDQAERFSRRAKTVKIDDKDVAVLVEKFAKVFAESLIDAVKTKILK